MADLGGLEGGHRDGRVGGDREAHRTASHAVYMRSGSSWLRGSELLTAISDFNAAVAVERGAAVCAQYKYMMNRTRETGADRCPLTVRGSFGSGAI